MEIRDNNCGHLKKNQNIISGRKPACRTKRKSFLGDDDLKKRVENAISDRGRVDEYENLGKICQGHHGAVYRVREKRTGEMLAMKEELEGLTMSTLMEIEILKSLGHHPSIVGFRKVAVDKCGGLYVVMEYMESDLSRYVEEKDEKEEGLGIGEVKWLMKQLVEGVKFLHQNMVMHRDLKPSNVLVNTKGELKICDFGLSTRLEDGETTQRGCVGTPGYRAPEMLKGVEGYTCAVDMWGVGCIMAELVFKKPLVDEGTTSDEIIEINRILEFTDDQQDDDDEDEDEEKEDEDEDEDEDGDEDDDERHCSSSLRKEIFESENWMTDAGFDLLNRLLSYDPSKRITAEDALNHVWFHE